jgi:hypothetical protein
MQIQENLNILKIYTSQTKPTMMKYKCIYLKDFKMILNKVLASSSIPIFFPSITFQVFLSSNLESNICGWRDA